MNNWKRIIALCLVVGLLAGCTPRASEDPAPDPPFVEEVPEALPPTEENDPLIDLIPTEMDDEADSVDPEEESTQIAVVSPDNTATNRPLAAVATITDEQALAALSRPMSELTALSNQNIVWGPGPTSGEAQPAEPIRLQHAYGQYSAYFLMPNSNEMYLSFDEGYELGYTPAILDSLKANNVKAVFFVTLGYVKSRPDLVQRMIDEGHIIGNHSSSHPVGGMPTMTALDMAKDVLYLHHYIKENFGYEMSLFRPPEGTFSEQSLAVLDALGYKSVFWSFAYNDWNPDNQMPLSEALGVMTGRSHPGAIYLLHAVSSTNASILGDMIGQLREKGYVISDWDI